MTEEDIIAILADLLDRPIAYQRVFVTITGSVAAAVMLSQAMYWAKRTTGKDGWFWKTREEWEDETGLSRYEQEGCRNKLKALDFWEEEKRGIPAKLWYKVDIDKLYKAILKAKKESADKVGEIPPPCRGKNHQLYTETTSETTIPLLSPPGDETDFSESEEASEEEQAPAPIAYPVIPKLSKEKTPRIAADHPTFLQDWERIWNRYSEAKPSTPKSQALTKAKKLTLDQWHTFKETFPSWLEEWERKAAAGESKYIPHLTTHLQRGAYTEPFRGGKGIVPASTQKPGFGPPEGFTTPFPNEPDRIGKYGQAHMVVLGDLGVVTRDETLNYLEAVASSSLQILMGKPALTADYEYVMVIDERVRVWHDEKGGKVKVREYLTKKKAEQGNDDEEYD